MRARRETDAVRATIADRPLPVLVVTQHYPPELLGSAPFCEDIARWLSARGRRVSVLTGLPAYPDIERFAAFRAHAPRRELRAGVRIDRLRGWRPTGRSAQARILAEALFLLAGLMALVTRRIRRAPVVLSVCPSILAVVLGRLLCRRGGRHVALVHDIQSGLADRLGMVGSGGRVVRLMRRIERWGLDHADLVLVLTREMRDELRLMGVVVPIEIVPVWADVERIRPTPVSAAATDFIYSGNLGRKQGLSQIIDFASELKRRRPELEIVLRGAGNQAAAIETALEEADLANVRREEPLPPDQLAGGLAAGKVHLVPQDPTAAAFAMPSKVIAIMSAARPIVATAQEGSPLWRLGRDSRAMVCVPPNEPQRLADAALRLIDRPSLCAALGRRARRYVERYRAKAAVLTDLEAMLAPVRDAGPADSVLIMEPRAEGHQREWLQHIVRQAAATPGPLVWLLVAPELAPGLAADTPEDADGRVRVLPLGWRATRLCRHRVLAVSAFARWWSLRRALKRTGAQAAHALFLDHLSLPLALGLGLGGRRLSGILFRPSVHYRLLGPHDPSLIERLRDWRKTLLYRLMLGNTALERVLSLDPYFPRHAARVYGGGVKVGIVLDPVHPNVACAPSDRLLARRVPEGRVVFVLFGFLSARKGTLVLLDALARLAPDIAARTAIMLAGRLDAAIAPAVARQAALLGRVQPELWLHIEDRHLAPGEIEALLERAQIVLAPYQRFIGSSGVLLWAARAGKPVLTQDYGLIGSLVREHRLGLAVNTGSPEALAAAIARMTSCGGDGFLDREAAQYFIGGHTPQQFAKTVLASLAVA